MTKEDGDLLPLIGFLEPQFVTWGPVLTSNGSTVC